MKENTPKKEIQNLIVETAHRLFIERGIKDVKMDDIAAELSISKRTIYELFNDKEQLLHEVLIFQHELDCRTHKYIFQINGFCHYHHIFYTLQEQLIYQIFDQ